MGKIGHGIRSEADSLFTLCSRSPLYNETWNMFFHNPSFPEINCNQKYNIMPFPRVGGSVGAPERAFGVREGVGRAKLWRNCYICDNGCIMGNSSIMENNSNMALEAVMDVILSRKSVRKYTAEPLTEAEIETLLRAGMAAPSAKNIQPWSFIVVTDRETARKLVTKNVNRMYPEAPCLIVICGDLNTDAKPHDAPKDSPAIERQNPNWMIDCSAAAENILLAAEAMGLGAVWTACWPYEDRYGVVKEVLGIPASVMPLAIIPVGHPAETPAPKDKWRPEKIHRGRW